MDHRRLLGAVVLLALAGATVVMALRHVPAAVPEALEVPAPSPTPAAVPVATLTVHVAGAVVDPGLVTVAEGARVADAIAAAGGATRGADLGGVNLAATVTDGMQLTVPVLGAVSGGPSAGATDGLVDVNRAGVEELMRLDGVGEVLARRIIAHREANGPFETVEDLLDVAGIGEGKLAAIRDAATAG